MIGGHIQDQPIVHLTWQQIGEIVSRMAQHAGRDGIPETLVSVLRGGAVPGVWLCHWLGVRDLRAIAVTHTTDDSPHASKTACPVALNPDSLGDLTDRDVLLVDDVAGTGHTLAAAARLVTQAGADRVRTAVCAVNTDHWTSTRPAGTALTYIGAMVQGWVIFPWECPDERGSSVSARKADTVLPDDQQRR